MAASRTRETDHISKIVINPENSNEVYVAALGCVWCSNEERGVFKTNDGGKTWEKILYVDENTGCADLAMDPSNPNILYAGMWDFQRTPYHSDQVDQEVVCIKQLMREKTGQRSMLIHHWVNSEELQLLFPQLTPKYIYALIESKKSGLYRSTDGGKNWELKTTSQVAADRPFYFSYIVPDPVDTNRIYKPHYYLSVSDDGGYSFTFAYVEGGNVHSDLHALWINPKNNSNMYLGTDGGLYISYDRGSTWAHSQNLPLSQFYHVAVDNEKPYNVYGGLQDNGSWVGPSQDVGGITSWDWEGMWVMEMVLMSFRIQLIRILFIGSTRVEI